MSHSKKCKPKTEWGVWACYKEFPQCPLKTVHFPCFGVWGETSKKDENTVPKEKSRLPASWSSGSDVSISADMGQKSQSPNKKVEATHLSSDDEQDVDLSVVKKDDTEVSVAKGTDGMEPCSSSKKHDVDQDKVKESIESKPKKECSKCKEEESLLAKIKEPPAGKPLKAKKKKCACGSKCKCGDKCECRKGGKCEYLSCNICPFKF